MTVTLAAVRSHTYVDSVTLLQLTAEVRALAGVVDAALVMATDLNLQVLRESGLLVDAATGAGANDLVIAVLGADADAASSALAHAEALLAGRRPQREPAGEPFEPRSLRSAHRTQADAALAVISVPGPFAAAEARQALAEGLHVFLFSDNVPLEDEVQLKRLASRRGLLVMGPDCGTAILGGVGLGFANVVRRGGIGVVGASGTGIQEVVSLIHQAGFGISHAIGTGSRDLHAAVGGVTTLQATELLAQDAGTDTLVLVSKPSDPGVASRVLTALAKTGKPAIAYLQGTHLERPEGVELAHNLEEAARFATRAPLVEPTSAVTAIASGQVRGLFCGGTLREEAALTLGAAVAHELIDFGDDQYTRGRAHPMLDPTLRNAAIVQAGHDPGVAVILLDLILGLGAHADPAGAAGPAIREALAAAAGQGRALAVLAHVVGTDLDPQGLSRQEEALRLAGAQIFASNYQAARAARAGLAGVQV